MYAVGATCTCPNWCAALDCRSDAVMRGGAHEKVLISQRNRYNYSQLPPLKGEEKLISSSMITRCLRRDLAPLLVPAFAIILSCCGKNGKKKAL